MDIEKMKEMAALIRHKRRLEGELKEVGRKIEALQETCQNQLLENGVKNLPLEDDDGVLTLYLDTKPVPKPKGGAEGKPAVVAAMKALGLDELWKEDFNAQTLGAFVRELVSEAEEEHYQAVRDGVISDDTPFRPESALPPELAATLDIIKVTKVRGRAS